MWYYIEWCDALAMKASWEFEEDILEWAKDTSFIASGFYWIIEETKHELVVAQTITCDDLDEEPMYNSVWKIPIGWIRKRKLINLANLK